MAFITGISICSKMVHVNCMASAECWMHITYERQIDLEINIPMNNDGNFWPAATATVAAYRRLIEND